MRRFGIAAALALCCAAPAGAVVGGEPIELADVPWYGHGGCGSTLVAPDRLVTAAHCVLGRGVADLGGYTVGGVTRMPARVAVHPGWRTPNGGNVLDDVAVVELDAAVPGVTPAALGASPASSLARIVGSGRATAPGTRSTPGAVFGGGLREATLRVISDAECARAFRRMRGNSGERFSAERMVCAVDADGRAPLSSGCNGDSGGPLAAGPRGAPVLIGVVSWGGLRCGADGSPSVFAEVARYRSFITDPAPAWAPLATGPATMSGSRAVGGTLSCSASFSEPARREVTWQRAGGRRPVTLHGGATHRVTSADAGRIVVCLVTGSNAGGRSSAFATARVPRS